MRPATAIAIAFACVGITAALLSLKPWAPKWSQHPPADPLLAVARADTAAVRSARPKRPQSDAEPDAIDLAVAEFRASVAASLAAFASPAFPMNQHDRDQIIEIACDRVRILLSADYETYVEHIRGLNRLSRGSAELSRRLTSREDWERLALPYRHCPIDASKAEVVPAYAQGEMARLLAGGMTTHQPKVHPFANPGRVDTTLASPADAVDVRVPIGTTDARTGEPITVFLVIRLARASPSAPWLPWLVGVTDPTDEHPIIPPPF